MRETWIINEVILFEPIIYFTPHKFTNSSLSSNGTHYDYLEIDDDHYSVWLNYGDTIIKNGSDWVDQVYRTVTFDTAPTGELLTWLQINAVKQEPHIEINLSTLPFEIGMHNLKVKARANGYLDSDFSDIVVYEKKVLPSYTIEQVGSYGFTLGTVTNPDPTTLDGVYQSNNKGVHSSYAVMKITFRNYDTFTVYIRSYAESSFDYTIASALDASSYPTSYSGAKASTSGKQKSGTALSDYTKVEYQTDGQEHHIYIVYRKDGSVSSNDDRGYVLIKK